MAGARVVLYVEDDDATFTLVKLILADEDPEIRLLRAADGEQALATVRRLPPYQDMPLPGLILLDLNLPRKNGFEVLADLKAAEPLRSIPVVIFSTSSSRSEKSESLALGAREYITKPSSFDEFVNVIRMACSSLGKAPENEDRK